MDSFGISSSSRHRQRHFYNDEQLSILDAEFQLNPFPNRENRRRISQRLGIPDKSVMWWFQNRRRRVRQQGPSSSSGGGLVIRNQRRQHRHTAGTNPYQPISPPVAYAENQRSGWEHQEPSSSAAYLQHQHQYGIGDWGAAWSLPSPPFDLTSSAGYFQQEPAEYQPQNQRSTWSSPQPTVFQQGQQDVSSTATEFYQSTQPTTPVEGVNWLDYSDQDSPTSESSSFSQQNSFPYYSDCYNLTSSTYDYFLSELTY